MPLIESKAFRYPRLLFNGHFQTIIPSAFRRITDIIYERDRLELSDGDFLDLDWALRSDSNKLVIISHGLEGSSERHYVTGMAKAFLMKGWDALAWNCRSCSGELNRLPRFYHHADTEDLGSIINHAISLNKYQEIILIGFSMGGNMTLKYLGEKEDHVHPHIKAAVTFSVPCDLPTSVEHLHRLSNRFYEKRFLKKLAKKIKAKSMVYPDIIDATGVEQIKYFPDFDNRYTAPLHGFKSADDFYKKASSGPFTAFIKIPTLLIQAKNDPFLSPECFPTEIARNSDYLHLETPAYGGHVGFTIAGSQECWSEHRAVEFVSSLGTNN